MLLHPRPSRHSDESVKRSITPSAVSTAIQFSFVPPLPAKVIVAESQVNPRPAHVASQLSPVAPRCQQKPPTGAPSQGIGVTVAVPVGVFVAVSIGVTVDVGVDVLVGGFPVLVGVAVAVSIALAVGVAVTRFECSSAGAAEAGKQIVRPDGTTTGIRPSGHCA
jgi:hypothetical protein